jgi:hypothetical protein
VAVQLRHHAAKLGRHLHQRHGAAELAAAAADVVIAVLVQLRRALGGGQRLGSFVLALGHGAFEGGQGGGRRGLILGHGKNIT